MQCEFQGKQAGGLYSCRLGFYGGHATPLTCARCVSKGQNNHAYAAELFARVERTHPANRPRLSGCCDRADQA